MCDFGHDSFEELLSSLVDDNQHEGLGHQKRDSLSRSNKQESNEPRSNIRLWRRKVAKRPVSRSFSWLSIRFAPLFEEPSFPNFNRPVQCQHNDQNTPPFEFT